MTKQFASKFHATVLGDALPNAQTALELTEAKLHFLFPKSFREILIFFGGAVIFNVDVKFTSVQKTFLADTDDCQGLELIYGLFKNRNGLLEKNTTYESQLPAGLLAFGEAAGGNLLCFEKSTKQVMFWHHEALPDAPSVFTVSKNFDDFLNSLSIDIESITRTSDSVIKDKSSLDF
jgi:SMI1-KNR4 cell-wall